MGVAGGKLSSQSDEDSSQALFMFLEASPMQKKRTVRAYTLAVNDIAHTPGHSPENQATEKTFKVWPCFIAPHMPGHASYQVESTQLI